jgi:putative DNA primase/helicase
LGLDKEVIRRILTNTNRFVFTDPLPQQELDIILRDEAFEAPVFYDGRTFLHNVFGQYVKNTFHVKRINGQLHVYDGKIYRSGYRYIESRLVELIPTLKANHRVETLKFLEIITPDESPVADANLICFNNGIFNLATGQMQEFDPDVVVTNLIPWDYDPTAYSELADVTLDKIACGDPEIRMLLEEAIGYCFFRHNELSKAFILTGSGSNGKSTYLDMVNTVLGTQNVSSLDIWELSERFSVVTMFNKLANIGDDISDEFLQGNAISQFKKVVSGNAVKAENKGQDAFFYKPYTKLLFSANEIPRMRNRGFDAIKRRLVIIPFNAKFSKEDPDFDSGITWKLKTREVAEYLIQLGLQGLKRVLDQQGFTDSTKVKEQVDQFEKDNNPILLFLEDVPEEEILNNETKSVYARYDTFCYDNGFSKMAMQTFTKEIKKYLNCDRKDVRINGKKCIVFTR